MIAYKNITELPLFLYFLVVKRIDAGEVFQVPESVARQHHKRIKQLVSSKLIELAKDDDLGKKPEDNTPKKEGGNSKPLGSNSPKEKGEGSSSSSAKSEDKNNDKKGNKSKK